MLLKSVRWSGLGLLFFLLSVGTSRANIGDSLIFVISPNNNVYYYFDFSKIKRFEPSGANVNKLIETYKSKHKRNPFIIVRAEHNVEYRQLALLVEDIRFCGIRHFEVEEMTDKEHEALAAFGEYRPTPETQPTEGVTLILYPNNTLIWYRNEEFPNIYLEKMDTVRVAELLELNKQTPIFIKIDEKASPKDFKRMFVMMENRKIFDYEFRDQTEDEQALIRQHLKLSKK